MTNLKGCEPAPHRGWNFGVGQFLGVEKLGCVVSIPNSVSVSLLLQCSLVWDSPSCTLMLSITGIGHPDYDGYLIMDDLLITEEEKVCVILYNHERKISGSANQWSLGRTIT